VERGAGHTILIGDVRGIDTIDHRQRLAGERSTASAGDTVDQDSRRTGRRRRRRRWALVCRQTMVAPRCCENDDQRREGDSQWRGLGHVLAVDVHMYRRVVQEMGDSCRLPCGMYYWELHWDRCAVAISLLIFVLLLGMD
jgi:hypothetical protein